jgi:WD40-like Beta Propeller Repeat
VNVAQLLLVMLALEPASGNATPVAAPSKAVRESLRWSLPNSRIVSARFGPGGRLAVVTEALYPDGHLAETYSKDELDRLQERAKREPRFADPVIRVLSPAGKETCTFGHGWSPALSDDGRFVTYENQKQPITGLRRVAEVLAGNGIRIHDCVTGEETTVAEPQSGHLAEPSFLADGQHIVFSYQEAINGSFTGGVGVGIATRKPGGARPLVAPRKQGKFWHLVSFVQAGPSLVVLDARPRPKPGDVYLADRYDYQMWRAWPEQGPHHSLGSRGEAEEPFALDAGNAKAVLVFDRGWRAFSIEAGRLVDDAAVARLPSATTFSTDFSLAAVLRPPDEANRVDIVSTRTKRKLFTYRRPRMMPGSVAWSDDGTRIAVVLYPAGEASRAPDQLVVLTLPK